MREYAISIDDIQYFWTHAEGHAAFEALHSAARHGDIGIAMKLVIGEDDDGCETIIVEWEPSAGAPRVSQWIDALFRLKR